MHLIYRTRDGVEESFGITVWVITEIFVMAALCLEIVDAHSIRHVLSKDFGVTKSCAKVKVTVLMRIAVDTLVAASTFFANPEWIMMPYASLQFQSFLKGGIVPILNLQEGLLTGFQNVICRASNEQRHPNMHLLKTYL